MYNPELNLKRIFLNLEHNLRVNSREINSGKFRMIDHASSQVVERIDHKHILRIPRIYGRGAEVSKN